MISTGLGLAMASIGIIGLALAFLSLIPINIYNIVVAVNGVKDIVQYEYSQHRPQWWLLPIESVVYLLFLTGSVISSLVTVSMVILTMVSGRRKIQPRDVLAPPHQDSLYKRHSRTDRTDIEASQGTEIQGQTSVWLGRIGCLVFVGQIGWALLGTHVLFFANLDHSLPTSVRTLAVVSVSILWLNYSILALFSFILFCASFFIVLGVKRRDLSQHTTGGMQGHPQESTPLLGSTPSTLSV
ncbi:hypothetical protein BDF14DRAFT_1777573 [Spinellus fusiger]|nr:hypothetical protein BDF14DRAFT_1777573 [Spinellus fusiger]